MVIDTINGKLQIDRGAMRGLAVTCRSASRGLPWCRARRGWLARLPDWTWTGFYAPKGTPVELVARLNRDIVAACRRIRAGLARLDTMGSTPSTTTPEEFAAFTRAEMTRWGDIIRRGNIKLARRRAPCEGSLSGNGCRAPLSPSGGRERPYETIAIDKLTPIAGAEISGIDPPSRPTASWEIHRALAENLVIFFRDQHITPDQHLAFGPAVRDVHPSGGAARARQAGADDHPRRQGFSARQWRGLAQRRELRSGAADGQHPLHQAPAARAAICFVRQHVRRLRGAVRIA